MKIEKNILQAPEVLGWAGLLDVMVVMKNIALIEIYLEHVRNIDVGNSGRTASTHQPLIRVVVALCHPMHHLLKPKNIQDGDHFALRAE